MLCAISRAASFRASHFALRSNQNRRNAMPRTGQPRRWAIYPYTDKEIEIIALRVKGVLVPEIAQRTKLSRTAVYNRLSRVYKKAGLKGAAELPEWAYRNALDEALPAQPKAKREHKKRGRKRISMRR